MLENNEGAIQNGQSRETGNIGYKQTQAEDKQNQKNTISVGHFFFLYNHNECIVLCLYCIIKERNVVYFVSSVKAASY